MALHKNFQSWIAVSLTFFLLANIAPHYSNAREKNWGTSGNFGLPGIIELPTAKRLPDGELVITHQNHKDLFMYGISFQALPDCLFSIWCQGSGWACPRKSKLG